MAVAGLFQTGVQAGESSFPPQLAGNWMLRSSTASAGILALGCSDHSEIQPCLGWFVFESAKVQASQSCQRRQWEGRVSLVFF